MATLISCASGNLTTSTTWALVDSTSLLDSEANNTVLTTSYVESSTFTPGAITIDGIAVKLASVAASPTGTISVRLAQGGSLVAGTEVTLNVSDLPTCSTTQNEGGWILFKFSAPVLLLAATAYTVSAKTSSATQVNLYRNATTANWSRLLRTTTTQAPVAGDVMHVMGEHTGAGTGNNYTVTMNETATTDYGAGTDGVVALTVDKRGTLAYATSAATNYYLKLSGDAIVYNGGTFTIGASGSEIPRDSTAILEFDPVADGGMGLMVRNGGTFTSYGLSRSSGKNYTWCKLSADLASGTTSVSVDTDTGWLNGDEVVIAQTNRSASNQTEAFTLNGNAGASSLTLNVNTASTHSGVSPQQAHVINITRNVIIRSATSTITWYMVVTPTAIVSCLWTRFRYMGTNTAGKQGITISTTTGSCTISYCAVTDNETRGFMITATNNLTITFNTFYNNNTANPAAPFLQTTSVATSGVVITDNVGLKFGASAAATQIFDLGGLSANFSRNVVANCTAGIAIFFNQGNGTIGTFDDNETYGNSSTGQSIGQNAGNTIGSGTINRLKVWNNNVAVAAVRLGAGCSGTTWSSCLFFGNAINMSLDGSFVNTVFSSCTIAGTTSFASTTGISIGSGAIVADVTYLNCSIGVATGIYTAHTNDVNVTTGGYTSILFDNCLFGGTNLITNNAGLSATSIIKFNKYQQTTNNHRWYTPYGVAQATGAGLSDTNVRTSGSLGVRFSPTDSTTGFSWTFKVLAKANTAVQVLGFIQKNAAFGSDVAKAELFLPGSTTADATYTMPNDTTWDPFTLAASYTGSVDLYATVKITAKTTTANAYIYIDDMYNGTNKITALDVWDNGQPSPIMFEQLGDPAAVWQVLTSTMTASGTIGNTLKDALTLPLFIGLK